MTPVPRRHLVRDNGGTGTGLAAFSLGVNEISRQAEQKAETSNSQTNKQTKETQTTNEQQQ